MRYDSSDWTFHFNFTLDIFQLLWGGGLFLYFAVFLPGLIWGIETENYHINAPLAMEWLEANDHTATTHRTWCNERRFVVHKHGPLTFVGVMSDRRIVKYAERCGWKRPHPLNKI